MTSFSKILSRLSEENRLRQIPVDPSEKMLDLSSNDYLSLAARSGEFRQEFLSRFPDVEFSSSASRLLSTRQTHHIALEDQLAVLYGKHALLFNSGYHANVGCIGALSLPSTLFVCDKLVHASIIDGLKMAGSEFQRFPHNDMRKLGAILAKEYAKYERVIIVTESIFSMDGDEAPLSEIVAFKREYPDIMIYLDEAHAFGVRGARGLGLAEERNLIEKIDVIIGTFGKAAASMGAFAISNEEIKSLLINTARPFIFSTALPPVNIAWTSLMLEKMVFMKDERKKLSELSNFLSSGIAAITGTPTGSTTQIIPLYTGDAEKALSLASFLRHHKIIALPIRRPTVPPGGERIRFSLAAGMDYESLQKLLNLLESYYHEIRIYGK